MTINEIIGLLQENRLYDAIRELRPHLKRKRDVRTLDLLSGRLSEINEKIRRGTATTEAANLELNQIRDALLGLMKTEEEVAAAGPNWNLIGGIAIPIFTLLLLAVFLVDWGDDAPTKKKCSGLEKRAIMIADFQDRTTEGKRDEFSYSLLTALEDRLENRDYNVSILPEVRERVADYHGKVRQELFNPYQTCDTSGLFVNGLLNREEGVFNVWITLANLESVVPELNGDESVSLSQPVNVDFSIPEDAALLADFIAGLLKSSEGKALEALEIFNRMQSENAKTFGSSKNKALAANVAFYRGNSYAQRGDSRRAKEQYALAKKAGNKDLSSAARTNEKKADRVREIMQDDPEMSQRLAANERQHSKFERELNRVLEDISSTLGSIFGPK